MSSPLYKFIPNCNEVFPRYNCNEVFPRYILIIIHYLYNHDYNEDAFNF